MEEVVVAAVVLFADIVYQRLCLDSMEFELVVAAAVVVAAEIVAQRVQYDLEFQLAHIDAHVEELKLALQLMDDEDYSAYAVDKSRRV